MRKRSIRDGGEESQEAVLEGRGVEEPEELCYVCQGRERATHIANELLEGHVTILDQCCVGCRKRIQHAIAQEIAYLQMTGGAY